MFFGRSRWFARPGEPLGRSDGAELDNLGTLVLPMRRERLLTYLPAHARVAEVGVATGRFSSRIATLSRPRHLALVDAWAAETLNLHSDAHDPASRAANQVQSRRYEQVRRKFTRAEATRTWQVVRGFSNQAVHDFEDQSFDWVYIDANHRRAECLEDLQLWSTKVKADGFLCGHDFATHAQVKQQFGVVDAVFDFLADGAWKLLAITVEHYPTFVLVRDVRNRNAQRFFDLVMTFEEHVLSVPQAAVRDFFHARIVGGRKRRATVMHFAA